MCDSLINIKTFNKHNCQEAVRTERDGYRQIVKYHCEEDTAIRKLCSPILGEHKTYGDSYGVPTLLDLVELLLKKEDKPC